MSLEAIREKILSDAREEAQKLLSEARHEKRNALEEVRTRLAARAEKDRARLVESLKERKLRSREHALREEERVLLNTRRTLMDQALRKAVEMIASSDDYPGLIGALLSRCDFTGEVEVVTAARDAERIDQQFLDGHSREEVRFVLASGHHDASGGVILRSGKVSRNATLEMMESLIHEDLIMELSKQLTLEKLEDM
jgi:vacuolar-type H+-ATPase subunit E/Vma4